MYGFTKLICAATLLGLLSPMCGPVQTNENIQIKKSDEILEENFTPRRGNDAKIYEESSAEETMTGTAGNKAYSWYCKHTVNGERPVMPAEMSFIGDYNAYFVGSDEKVLYLTFDAGYENGNIEKILNVLKEEQVPGAFFVLENLVKQNTDLVKRMAEEGHTVCNHTAKHRNMTTVSDMETFEAELKAMETIYTDATGYELAKYYRPPEGTFNEQNLAWADALGYKTIFWSFAYADWDNNKQMSAEKAKEKILSGTHNGEVLLLHPTSATNAEILKDLIHTWKDMGYRFGTLDELTGEK